MPFSLLLQSSQGKTAVSSRTHSALHSTVAKDDKKKSSKAWQQQPSLVCMNSYSQIYKARGCS